MKQSDVIRSWKDRRFRAALGADELAAVPEHPAGLRELTSKEATLVAGGHTTTKPGYWTWIYACCGSHHGDC